MVSHLSTLLIQRSKHTMHWMLCLSRLLILLSKHIHTFLPITFSIFNRFSIRKKFWKAETEGFSTIPSILYMLTLLIQDKDLYCIQCFLCWHCRYKTHPQITAHNFLNIYSTNFQSEKSFGKLRLRAFQPYHQYYICQYCWYKTRISLQSCHLGLVNS